MERARPRPQLVSTRFVADISAVLPVLAAPREPLSLSLPSLSLRIGPPLQPITENTPYASRNERWPCSTSASSCWPSSSSLPGPWCSVRLMARRSLPSRERRPCRERRFPMRATAAATEPPTTTHLCLRLLIRATAASVHAAYAPVRPKILRARPPRSHSTARRAVARFFSLPSSFLPSYFAPASLPFPPSLFVLYFLLVHLFWIIARGFRTTASFGSSQLQRCSCRLLLQVVGRRRNLFGRREEDGENDGSRIDGEGRKEKDYAFLPLSPLSKSCEKVRGYTRSSPTFSALSYILSFGTSRDFREGSWLAILQSLFLSLSSAKGARRVFI